MWSSSTCRSHDRGCRSRCTTSPGRSGASRSVPPRTTKPPESVYYERRGRTDGAAPPVLFLHGLGSSAADWAPQLGPFGERYRLQQRSEEHTSELQSQSNLVCRLLLEKKKQT